VGVDFKVVMKADKWFDKCVVNDPPVDVDRVKTVGTAGYRAGHKAGHKACKKSIISDITDRIHQRYGDAAPDEIDINYDTDPLVMYLKELEK